MADLSSPVLVTGANGFTGAAVVRALLKRGRKVRALIEPGTTERNLEGLSVERVYGNLLDLESLRRALEGVEVLHHVAATFQFAADPAADPDRYRKDCALLYGNNLKGTTQMLLAAQAAKVRKVVYTSTMACIGVAPGRALSDETLPFDIWLPLNDYMRSKAFAEAVADSFVGAGLPLVHVNPTWTVGPGEVFRTPIAQTILGVMQGRQPKVSPAGINIVDVDDVGEGHVLAEEKGRIGERYILGGENVVFTDFLAEISRAAGVPPLPSAEEVPSSFPKEHLWYDSSKAERELGFRARSMREAVGRAVAWFRTEL